jgi:hypothetical protein
MHGQNRDTSVKPLEFLEPRQCLSVLDYMDFKYNAYRIFMHRHVYG